MKNKINVLFLMLVLLGAGVSVQAKLYTPEFERNFYNQLDRHDMAIVHFNPFVEDEGSADLDRMKDAFFSLSKSDRYRDSDVGFIGVNLQKLPQLAQDYGIETSDGALLEEDSVPAAKKQKIDDKAEDVTKIASNVVSESTLILFKDGKPLKEGGKIVKRTGILTEGEIRNFIEHYFGEYIDRIIKEKRDAYTERERVRVVTQPTTVRRVYRYPTTSYYSSDYYPGYYSRPYWGGYYGRPWGGGYWGGPGVGIGFGFGGGRRGGFRGGFGFGW